MTKTYDIESIYDRLIKEARDLLGTEFGDWVFGYNPEYDRGVVELIIRTVWGGGHDEHTPQVCADLGITLP